MEKKMGWRREDSAPWLGTALLYPQIDPGQELWSLGFLAQQWAATSADAAEKSRAEARLSSGRQQLEPVARGECLYSASGRPAGGQHRPQGRQRGAAQSAPRCAPCSRQPGNSTRAAPRGGARSLATAPLKKPMVKVLLSKCT
ncbi:hypothetical protein NN561_003647 [Cricetulus griseus]